MRHKSLILGAPTGGNRGLTRLLSPRVSQNAGQRPPHPPSPDLVWWSRSFSQRQDGRQNRRRDPPMTVFETRIAEGANVTIRTDANAKTQAVRSRPFETISDSYAIIASFTPANDAPSVFTTKAWIAGLTGTSGSSMRATDCRRRIPGWKIYEAGRRRHRERLPATPLRREFRDTEGSAQNSVQEVSAYPVTSRRDVVSACRVPTCAWQ